MSRPRLGLFTLTLLSLPTAAADAWDIGGSKDHPLVRRDEGSTKRPN